MMNSWHRFCLAHSSIGSSGNVQMVIKALSSLWITSWETVVTNTMAAVVDARFFNRSQECCGKCNCQLHPVPLSMGHAQADS
eukprot:1158801-Pelagomonas_calceolata.AAC.15